MRLARCFGIASAVLVMMASARSALSADLWPQTKGEGREAERATCQALFRTQEGTSDSIDDLLVRTAMVEMSRGWKYEEGLTIVHAVRARRLLGLSRVRGDVAALRAVTERDEAAETIALAALELGRLYRIEGDATLARLEFDRAVGRAWRSETRAEAHLMRGWFEISAGGLARARADFRTILAFDLERPQLVLLLSSLAHVALLAGDAAEARQYWQRAREVQASGNTVSRLEPSERPELLPSDRDALVLLPRRLEGDPALSAPR